MKRLFSALLFLALAGMGGKAYAAAPIWVDLQSADGFSILAGSGISNIGNSSVDGYVGSFPTPSQTGMGTMAQGCTNFGGGTTTAAAQGDLTTAYNDAMGRTATAQVATELGGTTLLTGVYNTAAGDLSIGLGLTLVLDGGGNTFSVFIFQAASTLTTGTGAQVVLINGAKPENVFWAIGSSATLGTNTAFQGTIMALSSITLVTGATINGRLLARNGGVTVDTITVTTPAQVPCGASTPTDTPSVSPTATETPSISPSPTISATPSISGTPSASPSVTSSFTATPSTSATATPSPTALGSATPTSTPGAPAVVIDGDYIFPSPTKGDHATVVYGLKDAGDVTIRFHNQTGRLVDTIYDSKPLGTQTSPVEVGKFAAGTYYYVISVQYASGEKETRAPRKFVVLH